VATLSASPRAFSGSARPSAKPWSAHDHFPDIGPSSPPLAVYIRANRTKGDIAEEDTQKTLAVALQFAD
jgi:hypothetical protein